MYIRTFVIESSAITYSEKLYFSGNGNIIKGSLFNIKKNKNLLNIYIILYYLNFLGNSSMHKT